MPIIACPQCQKKLQLPDTFAGKQVQCPGCKNVFAPAMDEEPASAPAPPPVPTYDDDPPPPSSRRDASYDFEDKPRPARYDEDDEERRPRRRSRRDDDGDDDRPLRRRLKPHRGSTIQLLGILSIFMAQLILGPMAWIMGSNDLKEMDEGIMDPRGRQETQTGKTIGMVMTIIGIVAIVGVCAFFICMAAASNNRNFR